MLKKYKVINNEKRYHNIAYGGDVKKVLQVRLAPGANLLGADVYDKIKTHPYFTKRLKTGVKGDKKTMIFEVEEIACEAAAPASGSDSDATPAVASGPVDLSGVTAAVAKGLIAETNDILTLENWAKAEVRVGVKTEIEKRLEQILKESDAKPDKAA